ncbi:hypothetical protein JL720_5024 [Aureococcus anophagefferens]|nr:hypothetical protein JL720_5024 [Aureococcus anophagefferens]
MESRTLRSHRVVGAIADDAPTCVSFYDLGGVGFVCARVAGDAFQLSCWARPAGAKRSALPVDAARFELGAGFIMTAACHPPTYVNKIVVGSSDGALELWNLRSGKRVHRYAYAGGGGGVAAIAASGALDVVAVARTTGVAELVDAKRDVLLFALDHGAPLACLCFCRSAPEGGEGSPRLATGGADGDIRVWDLEARALVEAIAAPHGGKAIVALSAGGVGGAGVKGGGAVGPRAALFTAVGGDNAARQWALDGPGGGPRLVRSRAGHGAAPSLAKWYGPPACGGAAAGGAGDAYGALQLLSASRGDRSLRCLHAARDALCGELSQGRGLKWWDFASHEALGKLELGGAVAALAPARSARLLAVADDRGDVLVLDARPPGDGGGRVLRRFATGPPRAPRDLCWGPGASSVFAVDGGGALLRYDVASGACVDRLAFPEAEATSVSASPTGEFVATTHVGVRGVALWTDTAAYARVDAVALDVLDGDAPPLEALAPDDLPTAPPKKPERAPFFLPSAADAGRADAAMPPKALALPEAPPEIDAFDEDEEEEEEEAAAPGAADEADRRSRKSSRPRRGHANFDALQAYVHRLLQHHAAPLSLPRLKPAVAKLAAAQRAAAARFRALVHENLCLLDHASANP